MLDIYESVQNVIRQVKFFQNSQDYQWLHLQYISAGDVGDGVTDTRDGSAGTSCGVTTTFDLANGTAGAKRNSPDFFFTLLDAGKTSLGCEGAGKL